MTAGAGMGVSWKGVGKKQGESLPDGQAEGIDKNAQKPINAALAGTADLLKGVEKMLGIASPSTVFAGYGGNMMQGGANGIAGNAGLMTGAATSAAAQVSNTWGGQAYSDGREIGRIYARSVSGELESFQKDALKKVTGVSGLSSNLAVAALGSLGLAGPAGSGALVMKTLNAAIAELTDKLTELSEGGDASGGGEFRLHLYRDEEYVTTLSQRTFNQGIGRIYDKASTA